MKKILAFGAMLVLVSACYNSGTTLDKKNVSNLDKAVTTHVTTTNDQVTSTVAATSNSVTQAAKQLTP